MATATLADIRTKVRRLTRSPSTSQISDTEIDNYVNTFILYDFPENVKIFSLRETFTFYTAPNIAEYSTVALPSTSPLADFKNRYISIHPPVYIAGYQAFYTQSREQFFAIYPKVRNIASTGVMGTGAGFLQTGTLSAFPILQNHVEFNAVSSTGTAAVLVDLPTSATSGNLVIPNDTVPFGTINYITGAYSITWAAGAIPANGATIYSQTVPYQAALPQALLFYDDAFTVRPVPDQAYAVNMECYVRPTELLSGVAAPDLNQWWQYIAYGASKKIFEDRMDVDSVSLIMPEFKNQERLVLRKTLMQNSNVRTPSIYTDQTGSGTSAGNWGWSGSNF